MKQIKFLVEELHRGKWQPLISEKKGKEQQRRVFITEAEAEIMNVNDALTGIRYVKADSKAEKIEVEETEDVDTVVANESTNVEETIETVKAEYTKVTGKKPFHGWGIETIKEKIKASKEA